MYQVQRNRLFVAGICFGGTAAVALDLLGDGSMKGTALPWLPKSLLLVGALGVLACAWLFRRVSAQELRAAQAGLPKARQLTARTRPWLAAVMFALFAVPTAWLLWAMVETPSRDYAGIIMYLGTFAAAFGLMLVYRLRAPNPYVVMDAESIAYAQFGRIPWQHVQRVEMVRTRLWLMQKHALALHSDHAGFYNRNVPRFALSLRRSSPTERHLVGAVVLPLDGLTRTPQELHANAAALLAEYRSANVTHPPAPGA